MKSNFRRNTQKRKNKVNRKSSKITGGDFQERFSRREIPQYFIYDLLPKDLRFKSDRVSLGEWRDIFSQTNYKEIAINGFIHPRDIDGIYFTFARNGYENNWSKFVQEEVVQEEVKNPMHKGGRALGDETNEWSEEKEAEEEEEKEEKEEEEKEEKEEEEEGSGWEEEDKIDMRNHVDATNNIEEDRNYRDTTGNMKYICLSLINLDKYKKDRIEGLCAWITQKKLQGIGLTAAEQKELDASRSLFGMALRKTGLKKYNSTKGRELEFERRMISLFETITFIDNDNGNGKLIFKLSDATAERLNKRKKLNLDELSTRDSVKRGMGIGIDNKVIDYNKGRGGAERSPVDYLTSWAKNVTGPAFLYYINYMFERKGVRGGGGLKMNQKRNKTNISARGTKRKLCRKAMNKTNKKRGTYKRK